MRSANANASLSKNPPLLLFSRVLALGKAVVDALA